MGVSMNERRYVEREQEINKIVEKYAKVFGELSNGRNMS